MLGIIGGTGLYQIDGFETKEQKKISTPFGDPSAPVTIGRLGNQEMAFLPRHGAHHTLTPSEINYRANLWALKSVGVRKVLSVSAVGSLAKEIEPGQLAIADQYIDWTKGKRVASYFGEGLVAHISTAEPTCPALTEDLVHSATHCDVQVHTKKTYICVEGPRLGTRAESFMLKNCGAHIVGMTNVPEAFLAREAQLCYCTVAVITDYDCWLEDPTAHASVDKILALYKATLQQVQRVLVTLANHTLGKGTCHCRTALQGAVLTPESSQTERHKTILEMLRR